MVILFEYMNEVFEDDQFGCFGMLGWRAELRVSIDEYKIFYRGENPSKLEAERICFENFLNRSWYVRTSFGWFNKSEKTRIEMRNLPHEYQDLIWQLLDTMNGDGLLKLVE